MAERRERGGLRPGRVSTYQLLCGSSDVDVPVFQYLVPWYLGIPFILLV